jgi:hypothetical protein
MAHVRQELSLGLARRIGARLFFQYFRTLRFQFGGALANRMFQLAVPVAKQPVLPQNDAPYRGGGEQQCDRSQPPCFPPFRVDVEFRRSYLRRERPVSNTRADLDPMIAWSKSGDGDDALRSVHPVVAIEPI